MPGKRGFPVNISTNMHPTPLCVCLCKMFVCMCEINNSTITHHISKGVEYSVDPMRTSGGLYHSVTTSWEYVRVGTDLARANPEEDTITFKNVCTIYRYTISHVHKRAHAHARTYAHTHTHTLPLSPPFNHSSLTKVC